MILTEIISKDLNIPQDLLNEALFHCRQSVTHIDISKRNGSYRRVYQPSNKVKVIQYWLINHLFENLEIHECAMAYRKDRSIVLNAEKHRNKKYFLKLDFKSFFPSIKFKDFLPLVVDWNKKEGTPFIENDLLEIIRLSCFYYNDDILPIGFPTSPIISNIVMCGFDKKISSQLSNKEEYGVAIYTRYADDLTFSTDDKGACAKIKKLVTAELRGMHSPNLRLNPSKTKFVSSPGGSAFITGLRICHDCHITIHRKYKDEIRLLLSLYKNGTLRENDINSLKGHLSYVRYVDSSFYTKLQEKYFKTINKLLTEVNNTP